MKKQWNRGECNANSILLWKLSWAPDVYEQAKGYGRFIKLEKLFGIKVYSCFTFITFSHASTTAGYETREKMQHVR